MKKLLAIFALFFLIIQTTFAQYPNGRINVWPESDTLSVVPVIMIESRDYPSIFIEPVKFGTAKFYLQSNNEIVELIPIDFCESDTHLKQAVLKPKHNLTAGKKYKLVIEGVMPWAKKFFDEKWSKVWNVSSVSNSEPLHWDEGDFSTFYFGRDYGHGSEVGFEIEAPFKKNKRTLLVKITVNSAFWRFYNNTYYLVSYGDKFIISNEAYGGGFELPSMTEFNAEISLLDRNGNKSEIRTLKLQTY